MKNLNELAKRAVSGDQNALQKLISAAEDDIRFICTAFFGADTDKHLQKVINIIYARISSYDTSSDIVYTIRKQTAEICIEISGFKIFTDSIPSVSVPYENTDSVAIPVDTLKKYDSLLHAMQMIYYCTDSNEYCIFILRHFAGMTDSETASACHITDEGEKKLLYNAVSKINRSLASQYTDTSCSDIKYSDLLNAAAKTKPPQEKKSILTGEKAIFKTTIGKSVIIGLFALILIVLCIQALGYILYPPPKNDTLPDEYVYGSRIHSENSAAPNEKKSRSRDMYVDLVGNIVSDCKTLGLEKEGFVNDSDEVTFIQLIVTNSDSEMVNLSDLVISFSNGSSSSEGAKRYFTYNVFPINERTYFIEIFAPGKYSPASFRIDMYRSGVYSFSHDIPEVLKTPEELSVDINPYRSIHQTGDIITVNTSVGIKQSFYILNSDIKIYDESNASANLDLIPIGSTNSVLKGDSFKFFAESADVSSELSTEDSELPSYIAHISFDLKSENSSEPIMTDGYFSYNNEELKIAAYAV